MKLVYPIKEKEKNINELLKTELNISTKLLTKLIKNHNIFLNGKSCDTRNLAHLNDLLILDFSYKENNTNIVPTPMNLSIVYEDEWFLVINKPAGIPIHPSRLHYSDSLRSEEHTSELQSQR